MPEVSSRHLSRHLVSNHPSGERGFGAFECCSRGTDYTLDSTTTNGTRTELPQGGKLALCDAFPPPWNLCKSSHQLPPQRHRGGTTLRALGGGVRSGRKANQLSFLLVGLANNLIPCFSRVYYVISTSHLALVKKKERRNIKSYTAWESTHTANNAFSLVSSM